MHFRHDNDYKTRKFRNNSSPIVTKLWNSSFTAFLGGMQSSFYGSFLLGIVLQFPSKLHNTIE